MPHSHTLHTLPLLPRSSFPFCFSWRRLYCFSQVVVSYQFSFDFRGLPTVVAIVDEQEVAPLGVVDELREQVDEVADVGVELDGVLAAGQVHGDRGVERVADHAADVIALDADVVGQDDAAKTATTGVSAHLWGWRKRQMNAVRKVLCDINSMPQWLPVPFISDLRHFINLLDICFDYQKILPVNR